MEFFGGFLAREVKYVTETIAEIMNQWTKNGDKNFIVRVPKSHHIKEFELLLRQMLIHYQVPVRTEVEVVPIEIKCRCGFCGEARISDPKDVLRILCPNCNKKWGRITSGKKIEVTCR